MNDGRGDRAPFVAAAEAGHGLLAVGTFARARRDHMRDRSEEVRQVSLGFGGLHGTTHGKSNRLA